MEAGFADAEEIKSIGKGIREEVQKDVLKAKENAVTDFDGGGICWRSYIISFSVIFQIGAPLNSYRFVQKICF